MAHQLNALEYNCIMELVHAFVDVEQRISQTLFPLGHSVTYFLANCVRVPKMDNVSERITRTTHNISQLFTLITVRFALTQRSLVL